MNFIFPMGGLSSRFSKAGFTVPKFRLDVHGHSVFEHSVIGFHRYFAGHNFIFAFRGGNETADFVMEKCLGLGIPAENIKLVSLEKLTSGQAETGRIAIDVAKIPDTDPIVIFNIDTFQSDFTLPEFLREDTVDGYLEVFKASGDHWSFIEPGDGGRVLRVTEKIRISEYCSSGLYHFRKAQDFNAAFDKTLQKSVKDLQGGERYVAPLYNDLIAGSGDIRYQLVSLDQLTFCGTPAEYAQVINAPAPPTTGLLQALPKVLS
ncbi:MAG: hypothetical protein L3J33_08165, partial [Rhodobacteraceae bacterium]|nr:hypothetical protein [Paracoccaceae bacterium]